MFNRIFKSLILLTICFGLGAPSMAGWQDKMKAKLEKEAAKLKAQKNKKAKAAPKPVAAKPAKPAPAAKPAPVAKPVAKKREIRAKTIVYQSTSFIVVIYPVIAITLFSDIDLLNLLRLKTQSP